ncbi:amino acid ABC transporter substrate-binding protein [Usitatibacter palustris]|uniref:Glutamate/aspartate import solute-binding protein n=1 Tax=Usitatibacter palustris TaxID=2732487 RepID=A0A6M4H4L9_9PROT|nr:amino acid ABC transporter substrate-binding protein [Usitatibacter palustris]QJR14410.1 Glutamate/aspartate import solute-binding protein [Usitatibacter palustris]
MRFTKFAVAGLLVAAGSALAHDPDALADIKKRGTIRLGYSETSLPFSYKNKDGEAGGYSVEICKRIAASIQNQLKIADMKTEWVPLTPTTRLDAVAGGKVDMECGTTTVTIKRREQVDFTLPIFIDAAALLARRTSATTMADLQGKKVAVADKTTTLAAVETALKSRFINAQVVKTQTVQEAFEMLKDGKVDAMAGDRTALLGTFLAAGGAENLIPLPEELSYEPYAIVVRRGDSKLRLEADRVIAQLYRTGDIEGVYARWLAPLGKPTVALITLYRMNALPE